MECLDCIVATLVILSRMRFPLTTVQDVAGDDAGSNWPHKSISWVRYRYQHVPPPGINVALLA